MVRTDFNSNQLIGRQLELETLDRMWAEEKGVLAVIQGLPRIGKTSLLEHWLERTRIPALYWKVKPGAGRGQIRTFSRAIHTWAHPGERYSSEFTFSDWPEIWKHLALLSQTERRLVILDEYTDARPIGHRPRGKGVLTNADWDLGLENTNLCLILTCSCRKRLFSEFLSYRYAPLYLRARILELNPWRYGVTGIRFPSWSPAERAALYTAFSGIPGLWQSLDPERSLEENLLSLLLAEGSCLHPYANGLLHKISCQIGAPVKILQALANGRSTQQEIADHTGLRQGTVSKRLRTLIHAGYADLRWNQSTLKERPHFSYHLVEPFLRLYHTLMPLLGSRSPRLERDRVREAIRNALTLQIEKHTWPDLCREWVQVAAMLKALPVHVEDLEFKIPADSSARVDLLGINWRRNEVILGKTTWTDAPEGAEVLRKLRERIDDSIPWDGTWHLYLIGFARKGWNREAQEYFQTLDRIGLRGRNWRVVGAALLNLERVDRDLSTWLNVDTQRYRMVAEADRWSDEERIS